MANPARVQSVYDFKVKTMAGTDKSLADYRGQALLIVNTTIHCGEGNQYNDLEKLYERYKDRGFVILAFPTNDFPGQEPGDNSPPKQFCELSFKTSFPLFSQISVRKPGIDFLYQYLTTLSGFSGEITWNFNKFLVDRQGRVIARFGPKTDPMDPQLEESVLRALSQSF
ncbi:MAG: redoxin domain-containing protein [Candidatus Omnitrophica bacterium]|nr:redoxin domain-containing protein [Candidatus Omnitrophota bacterium]